ncbi:MAG: dihydroorotate dehydrogenase [Firmicutes bacterium]|jgi:dihydroorotate dehydrogenase (NAD+) catalytic subunit|nr:dihydroorotate dehydrogenase [Bacillota bacterium]
MKAEPDLAVEIAGIQMKNPLIAASGCYGYGQEYSSYIPPGKWGAIALKGTTLHPRAGNPPPRIVETPSGLINAVGLQNPGIEKVLKEEVPALREKDVPLIINVSGETVEEYALLGELVSRAHGVSGLELNISCPNVERGGIAFGSDPVLVRELVSAVRDSYRGPLIVKLSPNTEHLTRIAVAAEEAGADALSLINTLRAMVVDIEKQRPMLANVIGGLSGPAIRPVAVRAVWEVAAAVKIPLIGMGGIISTSDALQFILAGAAAVAIGTGNFVDPLIADRITAGIREYMKSKDFPGVSAMVGAARR